MLTSWGLRWEPGVLAGGGCCCLHEASGLRPYRREDGLRRLRAGVKGRGLQRKRSVSVSCDVPASPLTG